MPGTDRRAPSDRERYLAAVIRIDADKKLRRATPEWILQIARDGEDRFSS
ncbi:hypothetical protein [Microbacterium sp.]